MTALRLSILAAAVFTLFDDAAAQPTTTAEPAIPFGYVGSDTRLGLTVDSKGRLQGEGLGVFGHDGQGAWLLEGWLGVGGSGGVLGSRQWLWGRPSTIDTIERPEQVRVAKAFVALDRNRFGDSKLSMGAGLERESYALDVYLAQSLSGERQVGRLSSTTTQTLNGDENGRPYRQTLRIDSTVEQFEHPYEHGIGLRYTRSFDAGLLKATMGLDYELGRAMLAGRGAHQLALSIGMDRQIGRSGHSVGLALQHLRKDGPFDAPRYGGRRDDTRLALRWRFEFGQAWQPAYAIRQHRILRHVPSEPAPPAPPSPPEVRRTVVKLGTATLFALDSSQINARGQEVLRRLLDQLKRERVGKISVVGHTCDLGSEFYNQALSERRAAAIASWLADAGVPPEELQASGRGETEPEHPNDSEANRALNRRVVLTFDRVEEEVVQKAVEPPEPPEPQTVADIVRETVRLPAPWIQRALRTPPVHKREVDTYRIERVTETRTLGPREYLNRAPLANDDQVLLTNTQPLTINVLANDSEPDGETMTVSVTRAPRRGAATVNANGSVTYTPGSSFVDADSFEYTVSDAQGATDTAVVTVARTPNGTPVANDDQAVVRNGQAVTVNVLANDTEPDGDTVVVMVSQAPLRGTATVNANGTVTYTPGPGFVDSDSFVYTVTDTRGGADTATVSVTRAPNAAPVANDDSVSTSDFDGADVQVLANDSDPDGDPLTVSIVRPPAEGTASLRTNGIINFLPDPNGSGNPVTFDYRITDPGGLSATATVTWSQRISLNRSRPELEPVTRATKTQESQSRR